MRAWLARPENQNYFGGVHNAKRVRDWQKEHPDYWKNTTRHKRRTLQNDCKAQAPVQQSVVDNSPLRTLQNACSMQVPLLVGLISMLVGSTLPDDIAASLRQMLIKGHDILGIVPGMNLERLLLYEKTHSQSGATPENPAPVQLDRSPAGARELLPSV